MAKDIPIDSGSDFTADVVKAVEAIAQNIKNSSTAFTGKERDKKPSKIKPNASIGAGVKEAQEVSISGIGDDIRKSAMMAGQGQKTQEEALNDISKNLEKNNLAAAVAQGMIDAQAKIGDKPQGFKNDTTSTGSGGSFEAPS